MQHAPTTSSPAIESAIYEVAGRSHRAAAIRDLTVIVAGLAEGLGDLVALAYLDGLDDARRTRTPFTQEEAQARAEAVRDGARGAFARLAQVLQGEGDMLEETACRLTAAVERYAAETGAPPIFERCLWLSQATAIPFADERALLEIFRRADAGDHPFPQAEELIR